MPGLALTGCGDDDRPEIDAGETDAETMDASGMDADMRIDADLPELDADVPPLDGGDDDAGPEADGGVDGGEDTDAGMMVASCMDGRRNGDETGVDCGGPTCTTRCPDLGRCAISSDCASRVCIGGTCIAPSCTDGVRNGSETGSDCGGGVCPACGLGQGCVDEDDCAAGTCSGGFCVADHCFDGTRNVNETDVDCGGADCGPCDAGEQCRTNRDCNMSMCEGGFCLTPECSNGMPDVGEVDVDCGGECPGCDDGTACMLGVDCLSGRCEGAVCTSCNDGARNGDETGVDCGGGVCRGCAAGQVCMGNDDCASRVCTAGICEGAATYYREDFEGDDGGWTTGGTSSTWEWGVPAATTINAAAQGLSAWVTNLDGSYNASESSWIQSPAFNLASATSDPLLTFFHIFRTESCCDEGWVEVSTNGGTTWRKLTNARAGGYTNVGSQWWNGLRTTWTRSEFVMTNTAGQADVRLRFRLDADSSVQDEGFGFDDISVVEDICGNGITDPAETDVDCGGDICGPCDDGLDCVIDDDCDSDVCDLGTCVSCGDEIENGGETDLDCGGADCAPCNDTQTCALGTGCLSGRCEAGLCTSCFDGLQNGGETFIDCGGGGCSLCLGGAGCTANEQCASGTCTAGICAAPSVTGYDWDFEADDGGWTVGGTSPSWAWGAPMQTDIPAAGEGANAWVTNLTGNYNASENSWIESPVLDFSVFAADPTLSFLLAYRTEGCCDEGWVETSTNGGTTWTRLVDEGGATNWYNDTSNDEWDGTSTTWRRASNVLAGTAGETDVRIRFRLSADSSVQFGGFGFDDVSISASAPDLAVSLAPSANLCDGVLVTVRNEGSLPVSFFDLLTNVDGTMSTTRVTRLLIPGDAYTVELRAAMNLEASVRAVGDSDPSNDTTMFSTVSRTIGARYVETFEAGAGDWVTTGTNSSWAWGTPNDSFITNANSGSRAWVTNLTTDYRASEQSYLVSPCFDFSGFGTDPTLSFSYIHDTEPTNDYAFVEITTDGGETWAKLGLFGTGTNWYNDLAGDFWDGRSGAAGVWLRASHPLTGAAGSGAVRVRVSFVSNATTQREGFGVDDVILMP